MRRPFNAALAALVLAACAPSASPPHAAPVPAVVAAPEFLGLHDAARNRDVPLLLYRPANPGPHRLAVLSHGYGGQPEAYSFIARRLAERGWLVAAIDHELPGDPPIPQSGEPRVVRMPNWRIGADSIGLVIRELRARGLADSRGALLVGHSNGGDMAMLHAAENPADIAGVVSLDSRRMPFVRDRRVPVLSLRSSDQVADPGVIPDPTEQAALGMTIIPVPVIHNDMWDAATPAQKSAILDPIDALLASLGS